MSMRTPTAKNSLFTWLSAGLFAAGAVGVSGHAWAQEAAGEDPDFGADPVEQGLEPAEPVEAAPLQVQETVEPAGGNIQDEIRKAMEKMPKLFEYHGYLRSGFGYTSKLTRQEAFQAPGAPNKYRLGNETDEYGELTFVNNWLNPEADGVWFKTQYTLAFQNTSANNAFDAGNYNVLMREVFAQTGGVLASMPSAKFWAGQRFYRRHDIHINDHFFHDMSGRGAGVEDLELGFGKASVSLIGSSQDGPASATKSHLDMRLHDIAVPGGMLMAWVNPVIIFYPDGATSPDGDSSSFGIAGGIMHTMPGFMGGYNKAMLQVGTGPGAYFFTYFFPEDKDALMIRVTEQAQIQPSPELSLQAGASFQMHQNDENDEMNTWVSAGVRPVYHFNKYWSLATEVGLDYTDNGEADAAGLSGMLVKLTVAPQIATGDFFWARPVLRAYVTAATWTEDFTGQIAGATYPDDTFGLSFGMQMESWW
jgi:maltoporin